MGKAIRFTAPVLVAVACTALLNAFSPEAFAYSGSPASISGRTNKSGGAGCATCHGAAADAGIVTAITGSAALEAGQSGTYTVTATRSATADGTRMGVDIAASDSPTPLSVFGSMPTVLDVASGEIIHSVGVGTLRTMTSNVATYQFTYTMPAAAAVGSTHTLYAVAALTQALGWNHAPNFTVTTRPLATTSAIASGPTASTMNLSWSGGGPNYRVVYKTGAVAPVNENDGTTVNLGAVTSTTVTGLAASTQYTFKVFSRTVAGTVFSTTGATSTASTTASASATRHVNAATGVNSGACTSVGSPCKTITYAMSQALAGSPGDLVSVAPGTYNSALGEVFPIVFKSGVQLVATGSPSNTIISGTGDTVQLGLLRSQANASSAARIEGFTFSFGLNVAAQGGVALGGAVSIADSSSTFTVTRNLFDRNEARGYSADGSTGQTGGLAWGGAIDIFNSAVNITNNVFFGNLARGGNGLSHPGTVKSGNEYGGPGQGGAIFFAGSGMVANNTFYANTAMGGNGGTASNGTGDGGSGGNGAISAGGNPAPSIVNNIFANNLAMSGTGGTPQPSTAGALASPNAPVITKNLFFANSVNGGASTGDTQGTSAVLAGPQFHDAASANLHIGLASPARGAGTATGAPATDFDGIARLNPPSIGAFEASAGPGDSDNDGIPDIVEIAEGRNPLVKDNDIFSPGSLSARLFAMQQYRDFLGREGDAGGITGWTNLVVAGTYSRPQVIDAFVNSAEFSGFVAPVVRLYFATYLRIPDYAGLNFNAGLVRAGTVTLLQLADFFTASPEFVALYGSLNNTAFVTLLYSNVLGRAPDPAGLSGWVALLNGGMSRGQVLLGFSDSVEYQASMANEVLVTMMYTAMLRRTPELTGFNGWVAFLDALTYTREQVINGFFLSTEYRSRFLP